ncbi:hypothetical protein LOD99_7533 [Oopsacas minuta]|uniref:Uncharacterized protein n=1 Tax=Oopsacas minuta TaxID=111878 RepID=A0AAV7JNT0_9METZ|nr:hypothetical protein LOD99_7533 [Oopsacas minuta]
MSKNSKKPGNDFGSDPRNKNNLNSQGQLGNKVKARRMPPPATLSTAPKKESISESPLTPSKHWGNAATPDNPDKAGRPDWSQVSSSVPYQHPRLRTSVTNSEFPTLSAANGAQRDIPPQKEAIHQSTDRPPNRKPQEKRSNESSRNSNSYSNRQGQYGRESQYGSGRNRNYPSHTRLHQTYSRDETVPEMFAESDASPSIRSLPIKHINFDSDMDASGWAGKQDTVDYTEKIIFDSSGDEADHEKVQLRRIGPPRDVTELTQSSGKETPPNKNKVEPPLHKERARMQQGPEYRTNSPDSQRVSGTNTHTPVSIMRRLTSDSKAITPVEPFPQEKCLELTSNSPSEELPPQSIPLIPKQPQTISMRHTVPTLPSSAVQVSEVQRTSEQPPQPVSEQRAREDPWKQDKQHAITPASSLPVKGSGVQKETTNVWEKRQQNDLAGQQRQGLQGFPKLGENDPVQSLTIIPTKVAEKHELAGGRGSRGQDDDVFKQDKGGYHRRQDSWENRKDRERHRSDDKRPFGRQGSRSKFGSDADKNQSWRTEGNETEERSRYGDRGSKFDRTDRDDKFRTDRYDRGRREDRNDRGSSSHGGYQRRDFQDRDRNSNGNRRHQWRQGEGRNDSWRVDGGSNDRGQSRDNERRQFRDIDKRPFRDDWDRDRERGQYHVRDRDSGQFYGSDRDRGQFRDHDRGDKYSTKQSGEGRPGGSFGPRPGASTNVSYASAVSNKGENEDDDVSPDREGDKRISVIDEKRRSDIQENWRQPRPEGSTGHRYTQQRKLSNQHTVTDTESVSHNTEPIQKSETDWTDVDPGEDARTEDRDIQLSTTPTDSGFIEIRKKTKGRGMSSTEVEVPRSLGRGRGRIQDEICGNRYQDGGPGSRSMNQLNKPLSSTTEPRFSRGGSPQKSQGMARAKVSDKPSHISPKRSIQKGPDFDKRSNQHPRGDSPPPAHKTSTSAASSGSNYVQPGLSFSAIASKNITAPPPPPPPGKSAQIEDKNSDESAESNDETEAVKEPVTSKRTMSDSLSPDLNIPEQSDKVEHLSDENDEMQEIVSTTIVNSMMLEELAEIDQTPHAHMLAHSEKKEEVEQEFEGGDRATTDWSVPPDDRTPTPQNQSDKSIEIPRQVPVPSKIEERPLSNTPIQTTQPISTPISVTEHKKAESPLPPPTSNVFPDAATRSILQSGFNSDWFNDPTMSSLRDFPSYPTTHQQAITDDDKVVRNKQSDLSEYVNAPEFLPSVPNSLQGYTDTQYLSGSLATANFMSPNYSQDYTQPTILQSIPSLDATTTAGGLLTAPRMNPGGYPASQFPMPSVYTPTPMMPGGIGSSLRPPTHQGMMGSMRQFNHGYSPNSPSLGPFGVGGYGLQGNMRTAVMGADKNRRNDKMSMGDKMPAHPMYYPFPGKWDQMSQYNNPTLRKTSPATFTSMVQPNIRNYAPSHRANSYNKGPRKSNNGNNSNYIKSYAPQQNIGLPPSMSQYRNNQFISLVGPVGPVRAQQPQYSTQLRNSNNQFRSKNYYPRPQVQHPNNVFYYQQNNRSSSHTGPHITTVTTPSIESAMPPNMTQQNLNYQVQGEGDLAKSTIVGPQFSIQIPEQITGAQKFHPFSSDPNAEDSVASEYSKIGPVAVNGRTNDFTGRKPDEGMGDKIHVDNQLYFTPVPTLLSNDPIQQTPTDLTIKSHIEVSSSSPPSAMDIYGPAPLVSSSSLGSGSDIQPFQPEDVVSLPPADKPPEEQTKSHVSLEP